MAITQQRILVTGGAGFIGSHLVQALVRAGNQVTVIDNLSRGSLDKLAEVKAKINFIEADLRVEASCRDYFKDQDLLFNLAALNTGVDYDQGRTATMFEENMLLQMLPLRMAHQAGSIHRCIQISSASVYSREAMEHQLPTPETATTTDPEPSKLGYAWAKKMGELLGQWYSIDSPLEVITARLINVYGETDHFDDLGHFIPVITRKMLTAKHELVVFGSGRQKRSFIYVKDVVRALMLLAQKGRPGQIYNVDSQEEHSIKSVTEAIQTLLDLKHLNLVFDTSKPEGSQRRLLDNTKIRRLGWRPKTDFETGILPTVYDIKHRLGL